MRKKKKVDLGFMRQKRKSSLLARDQFSDFTGGTVSSRTLANLDCIGEGPPNRMIIGRKVVYHADDVIEWLESRTELLD